MPGFFTIAVINAFLKPVGKWLRASKWLNTSTMNGARRSTACFKVDVSNGSTDENLSGSCRTAFTISSTVRSLKAGNDTAKRGRLNVSGGALAVFEQTLATFLAKNQLKDSTSIAQFAGTWTRPNRTSNDCHSLRGLHRSVSILSCQKSVHFWRHNWRYLRRWSY